MAKANKITLKDIKAKTDGIDNIKTETDKIAGIVTAVGKIAGIETKVNEMEDKIKILNDLIGVHNKDQPENDTGVYKVIYDNFTELMGP